MHPRPRCAGFLRLGAENVIFFEFGSSVFPTSKNMTLLTSTSPTGLRQPGSQPPISGVHVAPLCSKGRLFAIGSAAARAAPGSCAPVAARRSVSTPFEFALAVPRARHPTSICASSPSGPRHRFHVLSALSRCADIVPRTWPRGDSCPVPVRARPRGSTRLASRGGASPPPARAHPSTTRGRTRDRRPLRPRLREAPLPPHSESRPW